MSDDPFDLQRFVEAQATTIDRALAELRAGRKRTHWMWFIFPQMRGLGHSPMAQHFGIASGAEARTYLAHPVLGPRLATCVQAALDSPTRDAAALFGSPDDMKFRSCLTLFAQVADDPRLFEDALAHFYGGVRDQRTLDLLARAP